MDFMMGSGWTLGRFRMDFRKIQDGLHDGFRMDFRKIQDGL
jgi:hypothetical protein